MTEPKLWSERDFGECCYALSGVGPDTMVCAAPCVGSYCGAHWSELAALARGRPKVSKPRRRRLAVTKKSKPKAKPAPKPAPEPRVGPTMQEVRAQVAARHGLTVEEITAGGPGRRFAPARHEACWEIRRLGKSYPQVAAAVGLKDHTSAIHGVRAHEKRVGSKTSEAAG